MHYLDSIVYSCNQTALVWRARLDSNLAESLQTLTQQPKQAPVSIAPTYLQCYRADNQHRAKTTQKKGNYNHNYGIYYQIYPFSSSIWGADSLNHFLSHILFVSSVNVSPSVTLFFPDHQPLDPLPLIFLQTFLVLWGWTQALTPAGCHFLDFSAISRPTAVTCNSYVCAPFRMTQWKRCRCFDL